MAKQPAVKLELRGPIVVLTINGEDHRNTLTEDVLRDLTNSLTAISNMPTVRAVVLTGEGRDFSLGGDHEDFRNAIRLDRSQARAYGQARTDLLTRVILLLYSLHVPVIAAINGLASGAGISLALACDLRMMDARAKLHIAYASIGASTDGGISWFLPRYLGEAKAAELLLLQPVLRAPRALALGLVHEVCSAEPLLDCALRMAEEISQSPLHAVRSAKQMLRTAARSSLEAHLQREHDMFLEGLETSEFREKVLGLQGDERPLPASSVI